MAEKLFPIEGEPMLNPEWEQIFDTIYRGVETGLVVSADGGGLRVFVSAGAGGVAGHGVLVTDTLEIPIEATASARTARIVLDVAAPYVRVRYSAHTDTQYLLATVSVPANAVTIAPGAVANVSKPVMVELRDALGIEVPDWSIITGKPSTFPSTWAAVSGKPTTFPSTWATLTGQPATFPSTWVSVSGKPATFPSTWGTVSGKPSTFAPSAHTHPTSQITGLSNGATTGFTRSNGSPSGGASGDVHFQMVT